MISPCCGAEYSDDAGVMSECCWSPIRQGLCSECKEHAEPQEGYICEQCDEFFEEPEKDYEYDEKMKENAAEARADEERDMN